MEKLLKDLMWKCHENRLNFEVYPILEDDLIVRVFTFGEENELVEVSKGYTNGWNLEYESAEDALERMHREVDAFLEGGE